MQSGEQTDRFYLSKEKIFTSPLTFLKSWPGLSNESMIEQVLPWWLQGIPMPPRLGSRAFPPGRSSPSLPTDPGNRSGCTDHSLLHLSPVQSPHKLRRRRSSSTCWVRLWDRDRIRCKVFITALSTCLLVNTGVKWNQNCGLSFCVLISIEKKKKKRSTDVVSLMVKYSVRRHLMNI